MGAEGSEEMFLVCEIEEAGEAFEGLSSDDVGGVVMI
jgi:hypothetical protein